jgi:two-component system OmpR family response regulator
MPLRILVVEDDPESGRFICRGLREAGHVVDTAIDGKDGLALAMQEDYDVVVLDRMLPGLDGLSIAKTLRSCGKPSAILFLTALNGVNDRVQGLDVGGDDYLGKPFAFSELLSRVHALGRRPPLRPDGEILSAGDLTMDLESRVVKRGNERVDLQPKEFDLLEVLLRNKGRIVTRTMLLERVWGFHFDPKTSLVETHISRLRAKVDKPFSKPLIQTSRGSGYTINDIA